MWACNLRILRDRNFYDMNDIDLKIDKYLYIIFNPHFLSHIYIYIYIYISQICPFISNKSLCNINLYINTNYKYGVLQ